LTGNLISGEIPMKRNDHERDTRSQASDSAPDCIEEALIAFERQRVAYCAMLAKLTIKVNQVAASSNATDLREIRDLAIRTGDAASKFVAARRKLARLSHFVE
jgi:hypothetical protein